MAAQSLGWDGETAESFDLRRRRRNPRVGKRVNLTLLLFLLALLLGVLEQGRRQGVEAHTALHACTATAGVGRGVATTAATTLTSTGFFLPRPTAQRDGGAPVNVKDAVLEANGTASEEEDGNVSSPHSEDPTPSLLAEAKAEAEAEESPPHSVNTTTVDTSLGSIATMSDLDRGDGLDSHAAAQANLVKTELIRRWRYVSSGQRERDLVRFFAVLPGGQASVVSLHGTTTTITTTVTEAMTSNDAPLPTTLRPFEDVNTDSALAMSEEKSSPTGRRRPLFRYKYRKDDPFPLNRYSLDLTSTTTESEDTIITPSSAVATLQGLHLYPLPPPTRLQLAIRALQLGWNFAPVLSTWGIALVSPTFRRNYWYRWLTQCMGQSGAAWIKWGQWSGTRHDMFPEALCDALSQLHNAAPAHPWSITETTLAQALHITSPNQHLIGPNGVFEAFDITPLASGSIAQVYKAVLDGHWIAVKVRHPHVAKLMDMDFRLMVMVAAFADSCIPALRWLHLPQSVQQFSSTMAAQSDLHVEAHHLEVLHHNFRHWPHVRFPQPFFANEAIILETFEPGRIVTGVIDMYDQLANAIQREEDDNPTGADHATAVLAEGNGLVATVHEPLEPGGGDHGATSLLDDASSSSSSGSLLERLQGHELIPIGIAKFLVTTGLAVYLKMLLVDNLMHADLHPGNIMVSFHRHRKNNRRPRNRHGVAAAAAASDALAMVPHDDPYVAPKHLHRLLGICLVDAGMVAQLTDDESSTFIGLLSSLGEGDGARAADYALQFSIENHMEADERAEFARDMVELFAERCRGYGTGVDVGHVLRGVLGLIRKHHVRIDANFATLVVNCLCIESLARSFCPSYNVLDAAGPLLRGYRRVCYQRDGTPNPAARKSRWVQLYLSLLYVRKNVFDFRFFRREARRLRDRTRAQRLLLLDDRRGGSGRRL